MQSSAFGMRPGIILLREGTDTSQVSRCYVRHGGSLTTHDGHA